MVADVANDYPSEQYWLSLGLVFSIMNAKGMPSIKSFKRLILRTDSDRELQVTHYLSFALSRENLILQKHPYIA